MKEETPAGRHQPLVVVNTAELSEEEWLAYRRRGIGGSDVAAILGISPFRTARDLYYDKLNIAPAVDDDSNWVALKMGHLLEDLVAEIFHRKTGYPIFQIKKMFAHPVYRFMQADVDYFVTLEDGSTAILEIKTTNYNAKDHWWREGQECVPAYYESQGRHYMAVMDVDRVFFCCLYGNTEDEVIIRQLHRDEVYEQEMIFLEQEFWEGNVLARVPPPYTEDGSLILQSVRRHEGAGDITAPELTLNRTATQQISRYLQLCSQCTQLEQEKERLKGLLTAAMGSHCSAVGEQDGVQYTLSFKSSSRQGLDKDGLQQLKLRYPDFYDEFVKVTVSRRFQVKTSQTAA